MSEPTKNDITGDKIKSKESSQRYRDNWDIIFGANKNADNSSKVKDTQSKSNGM
jgi:hypothetical protein